MSTTLITEPAAGWYHDPSDAGAWRWWDGAAWTDHVRASDGVATAPALHAVPPIPSHPEASAAPSSHYQPVPTHAPVFDTAAEPVPSSAPTAVPTPTSTAAIPQPGQVASAPAGGGPVSSTPETPVSDQMYWHSSAAEVIEVPRHHNSSAGRALTVHTRDAPAFVRDWNDLGSPHTPGIWLLAFTPVIGPGVYLAVQAAMLAGGVSALVATIVALVAVVLMSWIFAALDSSALADRGYHPPSVAWMLLFPPLAYFIARGKSVRRESKTAWPPELVFILGSVGAVATALVVSAVLAVMLTQYLNIN